MLAYQFRQAGSPESVLAQVLLQGQQIRSVHQPGAAAYGFCLWLDSPLWNHANQTQLLRFLNLVGERLAADAAFRQRVAHELLLPPLYQSTSLRPAGDDEGRLFPLLSLALALR
ncbi:hypothetical protein LJ737_05720 [Hymenobacter sp. 15J16-1T3B]|uniref:hypothetical protein n=1 Tax=Hymenobacter sp. 15J16-1T3B TaxID=2886941 RepID=UPI001D12B7CC|nr:hypothetical protein [Hymenobacter sp. 15J16-1T3B]MCC3156726.1 hypothetical protein [Hymenobacter sp. 15J16-1T3B]